jgi:hypothetical protein
MRAPRTRHTTAAHTCMIFAERKSPASGDSITIQPGQVLPNLMEQIGAKLNEALAANVAQTMQTVQRSATSIRWRYPP